MRRHSGAPMRGCRAANVLTVETKTVRQTIAAWPSCPQPQPRGGNACPYARGVQPERSSQSGLADAIERKLKAVVSRWCPDRFSFSSLSSLYSRPLVLCFRRGGAPSQLPWWSRPRSRTSWVASVAPSCTPKWTVAGSARLSFSACRYFMVSYNVASECARPEAEPTRKMVIRPSRGRLWTHWPSKGARASLALSESAAYLPIWLTGAHRSRSHLRRLDRPEHRCEALRFDDGAPRLGNRVGACHRPVRCPARNVRRVSAGATVRKDRIQRAGTNGKSQTRYPEASVLRP